MEDACEAARSITTANPNAALFVLFPLVHSSVEKSATIKNRRLIEDRLLQRLGLRLGCE